MRDALVREFHSHTRALLHQIKSVALVGGESDPEVSAFDLHKITTFGIAGEQNFLDLNLSNDHLDSRPKHDLVVCNQVLEHVWNHQAFFENLKSLVAEGGYLWISVPASNFVHSYPHYFSAGFTKGYIEQNLIKHGFEIVYSGELSSKRNYIFRHVFGYWLSFDESRNPLKEIPSTLRKSMNLVGLRRAVALLIASLVPNRSNFSQKFAVESYALAKLV